MLPLRPQPEMPVIHQELDAVLLGRDRIGIGFGNLLDDFHALDIHLVAALRARLRANLAAHDERRFLRQMLQFFEDIFRQFALQRDALDEARCRRARIGKTILPDLRRL